MEREPRPPAAASPPSRQRHGEAHSGGTRQRAQARSRSLPARRRDSCRLASDRRTHPQPGPGSSWRAGRGSKRRPCPWQPPATQPAPHTDRPCLHNNTAPYWPASCSPRSSQQTRPALARCGQRHGLGVAPAFEGGGARSAALPLVSAERRAAGAARAGVLTSAACFGPLSCL